MKELGSYDPGLNQTGNFWAVKVENLRQQTYRD
jgi:hypothetical protein